ncbi:CPBP family intramembrane glutamic endopeptidase [Bradyrhizobium japonicum]|uniref:CPBP family intramembrane glutamic endopeptidase n=1 Tax=Bradyrhizobium japonicum TaxID=375 RepID=UPI001BA68E0B|nr:CPBP family intramembrane glutamic endopeptidase [Bradyrhizobium japonicum]MBR0962324.1 CPBP family intramembrane metalloprotease [Bradyrhizobium japonicum]
METLFVELVADGAFMLTGGLAVSLLLVMSGETSSLLVTDFEAIWRQPRLHAASTILGAPALIAVLWIAVRMAGRGFAQYLALNWPTRDEVVIALGVVIVFLTIEAFVTIGLGMARPQTGPAFVVGGAIGLATWAVAACVVGPVLEEFVFRGFMFRGWSQAVGPTAAIVLTSALWAIEHSQYGWYERSWIFATGLVLGYFRYRTNSTWLAVVTHSAINTVVLFLSGPYV